LTRYLGMAMKGVIVPASSAAPASAPKNAVLQRVANQPILCHVLERMQRAGLSDVAIVVSEQESAEVRACVETEGPAGMRVEYLPFVACAALDAARRTDPLELAVALKAAADFVGDEACLVHVAEGLLDHPLESLLTQARESGPELVVFAAQSANDVGSTGLATRRLLHLADVAPSARPLGLTGVALFAPGALRRASRTDWWQAGALDLVAIAEQLLAGGGRVHVELVGGWRSHDGQMADLLELNRIALDALQRRQTSVPGLDNRIEGDVEVHPTACVQSSAIVGPAIVGPNACVLGSYIGPYTSIGANVHIEGAEVERSIILPGARITHIGGRLVGSVVGRDARVFRDFSLPRALRLNVGDGGEVALC
jgi:glucose-1-phosphate thymidylyltransferase